MLSRMSPRPSASNFLGILMLDTHFPRPPGDVGNPASWRMPVRHRVVASASPRRVMREGDPALIERFIDAGRALVADGARAITTSCGLLVRWQAALERALPVPVWSSSLLLLPTLPRPGVITVDATSLGLAELQTAGAAADTPVEGLAPGCALQRMLLEDLPTLDLEAAEADSVAAARRLVQRRPRVESLVLECTNLPPYAGAIERATGRPVQHRMTLVHERWSAL
jgi:hypothetical protein